MDPTAYRGRVWNLVSDLASRFRFAARLHGRSARTVFLREHRPFQQEYTLPRRKEVKDWMRKRTKTILVTMQTGSRHAHEAAWRQAAETWLLENGFLEVLQPKNVLPVFP